MKATNESNYMGKMPYTSERWRECGIWIATERGPRYTTAQVIGACAVHEVYTSNGHLDYYAITHIPTGRYIRGYGAETFARWDAEALVPVAKALNTESVKRARHVVGEVIGE